VLSYIVGVFYPQTIPITVVLALYLTVIIVMIDRLPIALREDTISGTARRFSSLFARIQDPWQRQVAEEILDRSWKMVERLATPERVYYGEDALYRALTDEVDALKPGSAVFAICADKTWELASVNEYMAANERAAARGVAIERIFYQYGGQVGELAQRQAEAGIRTSILKSEKLEHLMPIHKIPSDLGIAILNGQTVFLHSGIGNRARACRYDSPPLAALIRSQFSLVEELAEAVEPRSVGASPIDDSTIRGADRRRPR
jgi:hypothetical protein